MILGGKPQGPTIGISSCGPTQDGNGCAANVPFFFAGSGYDSKKLYIIEGSSPEDPGYIYQLDLLRPDANGDLDPESYAVKAGTWTFDVYEINHNATPQKKLLATTTEVFE